VRLTLTGPEKTALDAQIMKANEKKLLNSKNAVIYDMDEQKIKEIKGLVMHRGADGKVMFQVLEKRNAVTFRRKTSTVGTETKEEAAV